MSRIILTSGRNSIIQEINWNMLVLSRTNQVVKEGYDKQLFFKKVKRVIFEGVELAKTK
jgi:hypothetical protein